MHEKNVNKGMRPSLRVRRFAQVPGGFYKMETGGQGNRNPTTVTSRLLSPEAVSTYHKQGFWVEEGLFDKDEAAILLENASGSGSSINSNATGVEDASGRVTKLSLFNTPGVNVFGAVPRTARIVDNVEQLLAGCSHGAQQPEEAYHYHSKVMIKDPKGVGGAWEWHQDYGYWYSNGILLPKMISCMIALNDHTIENGCLRILPRSHHLGRVTHGNVGGQAGAEPDRLKDILERYDDEPVLLKAGDALFFHANLFHASTANTSDGPRWSMISCFNTRSNNPTREHHHPRYTPHDRWPDSAIRDLQDVNIMPGDGTTWYEQLSDSSVKGDSDANYTEETVKA